MPRRRSWLALAAGLALLLLAAPAHAQLATPAPAWTALFDRTSGWTGADGIFSFSADGWDGPGDPDAARSTIFVFSDTFIGRVNAAGVRSSAALVRNSAAHLDGTAPVAARMRFVWGHANGKPVSLVAPNTADTEPGEWYWPVDGVVTGGVFHLFAQRMEQTQDGGAFNFAVTGINLLSQPVATLGRPGAAPTQLDAPLTVPAAGGTGLVQFGNGVMANTAEAGSPLADGYIYIYGLRNDAATKWLLAARVPSSALADFSQYRFWNGTGWVADLTAAAPLIDRLSSEFSVTPLADGRYALVYQLDTLSSEIAISYGPSPIGPFTAPLVIYHCPEPAEYPGQQVYTYNAKAHPALSAPGHLLISYNVNSFSLQANLNYASIYHPRFIDLAIGE